MQAPAPSTSTSPYRRIVEVQAAHAAGDALVAIALARTLFFSVPIGQARDRVGLYLLLAMTPFALISPVVGPLLDRWRGSYRIAIIAAAVGRSVLAFSMAPRTDRLVLYPMAFGMLVLSRTHGVSRCALLPDVVPPKRTLMSANGRLAVVSLLGGTAAALPGALFQWWLGPGATLRFAGAVFAMGALAATGLPLPETPKLRRQVVRGAHRLLAPRLLAGGMATAAIRAAVGFVTFLLGFVLRAGGHGAGGFVLVLAGAGAGGLAGALLAPRLRGSRNELRLMLGSLAAIGVVSLLAAYRFDLLSASILSGVTAFCASGARLGFDSLIQREAPEEVRGRTFARYETIFQLCWVGGAGLATGIPFAPSPGLVTLAGICAAGIVLALRGALRPPPPGTERAAG